MVTLLALRDQSDLHESLYAAVGWTMRIWAMVENEMAHILHQLLEGNVAGQSRSRQAYSMFYSVQNLKPRMDLVDAAFHNRADLDAAVVSNWKKLIDRIQKESTERNQIVHGSYINGFDSRTQSLGFWVAPKIFSDLHRRQPPEGVSKQGYETADIERHAHRVDILRHGLWRLRVDFSQNDAAPANTVEEYLAAWAEERGKREWPSP